MTLYVSDVQGKYKLKRVFINIVKLQDKMQEVKK